MLNKILHFCVETLQEIAFHTLSLMNFAYPSTIYDKSSASYACALAQYSMSSGNKLAYQLKYQVWAKQSAQDIYRYK